MLVHSAAIDCLTAFDDCFVTGSADHTLRVFKKTAFDNLAVGQTDPEPVFSSRELSFQDCPRAEITCASLALALPHLSYVNACSQCADESSRR